MHGLTPRLAFVTYMNSTKVITLNFVENSLSTWYLILYEISRAVIASQLNHDGWIMFQKHGSKHWTEISCRRILITQSTHQTGCPHSFGIHYHKVPMVTTLNTFSFSTLFLTAINIRVLLSLEIYDIIIIWFSAPLTRALIVHKCSCFLTRPFPVLLTTDMGKTDQTGQWCSLL